MPSRLPPSVSPTANKGSEPYPEQAKNCFRCRKPRYGIKWRGISLRAYILFFIVVAEWAQVDSARRFGNVCQTSPSPLWVKSGHSIQNKNFQSALNHCVRKNLTAFPFSSHVRVRSLLELPLASTSPAQRGNFGCHPILFAIQQDRTTTLTRSQNWNLISGAQLSR
jgi:hypothetical protein